MSIAAQHIEYLARPRPPWKWCGGKTRLVEQIRSWVPAHFTAYHEPFAGGAAVFWALHEVGPAWYISDDNPELMNAFEAIRDDVHAVICTLREHVYEKDYYYRVRAMIPEDMSATARAARFMYLNRCGFNGLYRVNKAGRFNVPFGAYVNPTICDAENLHLCSHHLQGVNLRRETYLSVENVADQGHFVYLDCPYLPLSATSNFTGYTSDGFSLADHERLRDLSLRLADKGVHVVLSQSAAPAMRELYDEVRFEVRELQAARNVNCKKEKRAPVTELLIRPRVRG